MGKALSKAPDITKAEVARKMYELIKDEEREVIAKAFVEGANLTPKGSMTYVYNIRRKMKKKEMILSSPFFIDICINDLIASLILDDSNYACNTV